MKKLYFVFAITLFMLAGNLFNVSAQAPEGFTYQAEARDASGKLLTTKALTVETAILTGSATGSVAWQKQYNVTTDNYGLFSIIIGEMDGIPATTGEFSKIEWGNGTYFLNVKVMWTKKWLDMGTTQLLSVPYALYAKSAGSAADETDPVYSANFDLTGAANGDLLKFNGSRFVKYSPDFNQSNYVYNGKYGVKFQARNDAQDNVDFVLSPKGNGAILRQQPDGTTAGGNIRGQHATDLQAFRESATQVASGDYSVIVGGGYNTASGRNSVAMGFGNAATATGSIGIGAYNTASGAVSVAMGVNSMAKGDFSTSTGYYTVAPSGYETVMGCFNTEYTPLNANGWNSNDRLFVLGNGTPHTNKSNALTILKNANTTIGGSLTINGNGTNTSLTFPTERGTSGQILSTDGSGGTSWATPNAGTVTNVSGTSPISVATGTSTPVISIAAATPSTAGSMSAVDKTKLDGIPTLSIGQSYQGGIIFWLDATGQHGLIAATADQSTGIQWYNGSSTTTNAVRDGIGAGMFNTERIISNQGVGDYAAQLCANYQGGGYGDWYLPSKYELNLLYLQKTVVGGFTSGWYLSSSEYSSYRAWGQSFNNGTQGDLNKFDPSFYVRAVRSF